MKQMFVVSLLLLAVAISGQCQGYDQRRGPESASVSVGRTRGPADYAGPMPHPYRVEQRRWPVGCEAARQLYIQTGLVGRGITITSSGSYLSHHPSVAALDSRFCGEIVMSYEGENLVTSVGQTAVSKQISDTAAQPAAFNYIALTNTAITPAVADTTLSGEIVSNGLSRAQGTFADVSAAIGVPPTPASPTTVGTSGAATLYYWVFACTPQGCTAVGSSSNLTTANATLTTGNYVSVTWTGKVGASHYVVIRTQGSGAPSGAIAGGSTQATTGQVTNTAFCSTPVAGTAPTCTIYDQSNNTVAGQFGPSGTSTTIPAADQTFFGKFTLTKTFTATGTQAAQAFGILNASSNGTMAAEGTFTQASLILNDTLAFTWTNYH